jgi:hypothetical protein
MCLCCICSFFVRILIAGSRDALLCHNGFMSRNDDISVAERCKAACKLLATSDDKLKFRLNGVKATLLPLGHLSPLKYSAQLAEINDGLMRLEQLRREALQELAGKIFELALLVHADTFSD